VNLGYVLNVIEDVEERSAALREAWQLAQKVLVVASLVTADHRSCLSVPFADGVVTGLGTFQKYYTQGELKGYIERVLGAEALAASLGVFYVFRDEGMRQEYLRTQFTHPAPPLRPRISELLYEQHRDLLQPLAERFSDLGRLPEPDELPEHDQIRASLGSTRKAFRIIQRVTESSQWKDITARRRDDTIVHLALMRFGSRPPVSSLPIRLQRDIRAFLGPYSRACETSDEALFRSGAEREDACTNAPIGKLMPRALYIHQSALGYLPLSLRIMEGCARKYLGLQEGGTVLKFHRTEPELSYLMYPTFESEAHPALAGSIKFSLRSFEVVFRDYSNSGNPPVLHRKEEVVHQTHPQYETFSRLTQAEVKAGLLGTPSIGNRDGWQVALAACRLNVVGHELTPIVG
jgi:DNA phosphorothioation-associated putative methyltransferase